MLTVNRLPEEGGLTAGGGVYLEGQAADLSVKVVEGYTFAGWVGDLLPQ